MTHDAVLLDLDGTLVETTHLYERAYVETLAVDGVQLSSERFRELYVTGLPLEEWLRHLDVDRGRVAEIRKRRDTRYIDLLKSDAEWRDGAREALDALSARLPTGIVTGSWSSYVDAIDERLSLLPRVRTIVTADDVRGRMKPDPHGLLLAAQRLSVDPKRCVYIGDQAFDVVAARAAGMKGILIRGKHTPAHAEGDHEAQHWNELISLL